MTKNYIGEFKLSESNNIEFVEDMTKIPEKKEWHHYPIWQFNGKRYRPLTQKAEDNLSNVIKNLESLGFTAATKPGKIKPSSLKYAVLTNGVEEFTFIK